MELVTVRNKFEIVIPETIREQAGVGVGDLLKASVVRGKITLTPTTAEEQALAEALADVREGRTHGPYGTAAAAVATLTKRTAKPKARRA